LLIDIFGILIEVGFAEKKKKFGYFIRSGFKLLIFMIEYRKRSIDFLF